MDVAEHTDAAVAALREELIGLVTAAGGTMTLDALRSARPAWFRGAHILALNCRRAHSKCGGREIRDHFRRTLFETLTGRRRTYAETQRKLAETDARS